MRFINNLFFLVFYLGYRLEKVGRFMERDYEIFRNYRLEF